MYKPPGLYKEHTLDHLAVMMNTTISFDQSDEARQEHVGVTHHGRSHSHLILTLAHILLALWAWLANLTQIVNIVLDRKLRRQPRNKLIVSISVSELLVAGFLCPLYTDSLVRGPWRHGLLVCSLYEVVFYLQVSVSSLAVLVLNLERFYFLLAPRMLQAPARRHVTNLLTSLPWVASVAVVVPLFLCGARATLEHVAGLHHRTCVVEWDRTLHIVTVFVTFLAPAFLLLATAVAVLLIYVISAARAHEEAVARANREPAPASADPRWHHSEPEHAVMGGRSRRRHFSGLQELDGRTKRECVTAVCASSFLSVGLQFPFFTLLLLQKFCEHSQQYGGGEQASSYTANVPPESALHTVLGSSDTAASPCHFSDLAWATCMMLGMAKPGVLPVLWLLYADIRAGLSLRACVRSWKCFKTARLAAVPSAAESDGCESAYTSAPSLASQMTMV